MRVARVAIAPSALLALAAGAACAPHPAPEPLPPVVIDAEWDDWRRAPAAALDSADAPDAEADFLEARVRDDAEYVYLYLDLGREVNSQGLNGSIAILFDADGDRATGANEGGLPGADLVVELTPRDSLGRPAQGVALRVPTGPPGAGLARPGLVRHDAYALDLAYAPTHAGRRLEIRLARGRSLGGGPPLFAGAEMTARLALTDAGGTVRDQLGPFTHRLGTAHVPAAAATDAAADPLARAPGTDFRVVAWNVADRGLFERPDVFRRILAAIDADIVMLDEVSGQSSADEVRRFLTLAGRHPGGWQLTYGLGGGYQRGVVASRATVTPVPRLAFLPFPDTAARRILERVPLPRRARVLANMDSGVAVGGAFVTLGRRRVLAVPVDLQSAGNSAQAWQDQRRQLEARLVRDAVRLAVAEAKGGVAAVIVAGDFNLVGSRMPLDTLLTPGLDVDGSALAAAHALQLDGRTTATWDGREGPFAPGRLDWVLYGDASLRALRAFAFDTRDLGPRWLARHALDAADGGRASDHMPVVVDFAWR